VALVNDFSRPLRPSTDAAKVMGRQHRLPRRPQTVGGARGGGGAGSQTANSRARPAAGAQAATATSWFFQQRTNQPHKAEGQDPEAQPKPRASAEAAPASPGCSTQPEARS